MLKNKKLKVKKNRKLNEELRRNKTYQSELL